MPHVPNHQLRLGIVLFGLGFLGVLSALPLIPQLMTIRPEGSPLPVPVLQLLSTIQSSVILAGFVAVGLVFARKTNLAAPALAALARGEDARPILKSIWIHGALWGIAGGLLLFLISSIFSSYLPTGFLVAAEDFNPPWYTKLLYGGITEEVLVRWGLMSFLVWLSYKLTQRSSSSVRPHNYIVGIALSSLLFGAGHLPVASLLATELTPALASYIVLANAAFGLVAGFLYWRRGLEAAILAHMTAHLTLLAATASFG